MSERPILFSGPMVRAILDGRKTMTRRVLSGRYIDMFCCTAAIGECNSLSDFDERDQKYAASHCPYGMPGDRLWVREVFGVGSYEDGGEMVEGAFHYRATEPNWKDGQWKPSIHMPRRACRITLEVEAVRVERVQNITAQDALMEGACDPSDTLGQATIKWICLWNSINEKRGYGWDLNPWVWVIQFRAIQLNAPLWDIITKAREWENRYVALQGTKP